MKGNINVQKQNQKSNNSNNNNNNIGVESKMEKKWFIWLNTKNDLILKRLNGMYDRWRN